MDLSKAFDTINHELLLAKLYAYGFSMCSLLILTSYLSKRNKRIKINNPFSFWTDLIQGVPQGQVLGSLLFNTYLNNLFFTFKKFVNFEILLMTQHPRRKTYFLVNNNIVTKNNIVWK